MNLMEIYTLFRILFLCFIHLVLIVVIFMLYFGNYHTDVDKDFISKNLKPNQILTLYILPEERSLLHIKLLQELKRMKVGKVFRN